MYKSEKWNIHVQVVLRENYGNIEITLNASLNMSMVSFETGCPALTPNSLNTCFKYHLRMVGDSFLVNLTHDMISISSNSGHPRIVKLISPLEFCRSQILCQLKFLSIVHENSSFNYKFCL